MAQQLTDLEQTLNDHNTYHGQTQLFFDENGSECWASTATTILTWSQGPRGIGYYEK